MKMIKSVCLLCLVIYQCCDGYPRKGISGELTDDTVIQNDTNIITDSTPATSYTNKTPNTSSFETSQRFSKIWDVILHLEDLTNQSNNTSNTSDEMHGTSKKVVTKVKESFNKVKNKVKGGFDKVKNKVKVGIDKIKDKVGKIKDNIGTGGGGGSGGTGGGGYGNYYRRPYDRPTSSGYGGGGNFDLTVVWVFLGLAIAGVIGTVLYFMIKAY